MFSGGFCIEPRERLTWSFASMVLGMGMETTVSFAPRPAMVPVPLPVEVVESVMLNELGGQ